MGFETYIMQYGPLTYIYGPWNFKGSYFISQACHQCIHNMTCHRTAQASQQKVQSSSVRLIGLSFFGGGGQHYRFGFLSQCGIKHHSWPHMHPPTHFQHIKQQLMLYNTVNLMPLGIKHVQKAHARSLLPTYPIRYKQLQNTRKKERNKISNLLMLQCKQIPGISMSLTHSKHTKRRRTWASMHAQNWAEKHSP